MNKFVVFIILLLLIPIKSFCQDFSNIGNQIYFAKSMKALGFHQGDADIDGDGKPDVVGLIAYDDQTSFFKTTKLINIVENEWAPRGRKKIVLPNKPSKTPRYAIVVFLSSKNNLPYVVYNSTFFQEYVADNEIRSGAGLIPHSELNSEPLQAPLNMVELNKDRVRGDLLEAVGCMPDSTECDNSVLIYWNGKKIESVWVGGYGG